MKCIVVPSSGTSIRSIFTAKHAEDHPGEVLTEAFMRELIKLAAALRVNDPAMSMKNAANLAFDMIGGATE